MRNPESVLENETHKPLRDYAMQTDYLILAWTPDSLQKKREPAELWILPSRLTTE